MFLFFFPKQATERTAEFCLIFLKQFYALAETPSGVLVESEFDYNYFEERLDGNKNIRIWNLLSELQQQRLSQSNKKRILNEYGNFNFNKLFFIKGKAEIQGSAFEDAVFKYILFYEQLTTKHQIKGIHFGINQAFRSLGGSILYEYARLNDIPFFMVFNTPMKGRHYLYDNYYLNPKSIENEYLDKLNNGISPEAVGNVEDYFEAYKKFKADIHGKRFEQKHASKKKERIKLRMIPTNILQNAFTHFCNIRYKKVKNPKTDGKPYVLLLLNKTNNWLSNYALPYFGDISNLVRSIWLSIPPGFNLIIKDHPLNAFPNKHRINLYEFARQVPNIYYFTDSIGTYELVDSAKVVLYNCSTSGVESLMQFKHVVTFGKNPIFFDFKSPPIQNVTNMEDLPAIIKKCIEETPPKDKIYAYFQTLLEHSENYHGDPEVCRIDFTQDHRYFRKMAQYLYKNMEKKEVI